jgi:hypothetical protein
VEWLTPLPKKSKTSSIFLFYTLTKFFT